MIGPRPFENPACSCPHKCAALREFLSPPQPPPPRRLTSQGTHRMASGVRAEAQRGPGQERRLGGSRECLLCCSAALHHEERCRPLLASASSPVTWVTTQVSDSPAQTLGQAGLTFAVVSLWILERWYSMYYGYQHCWGPGQIAPNPVGRFGSRT